MIRALAVVAMIVMAAPSSACINTFITNFLHYKREGNTEYMAQALAEAEAAHRKSPTLENTNDLAVGWILSGSMEKGLQLLRDLERSKPGNAIVASNLGTALELSGQDAEALKWIRESVRRDPKEHYGSEWVHVKILEAKLAMKQDPEFLRKQSVIGWRPGQPLPVDELGQARSFEAIDNAITYQLFERVVFVHSPDPIVGDLYTTSGDIDYARFQDGRNATDFLGRAFNNYHWALKYGTVHEDRVRPLVDDMQRQFDADYASRDEEKRKAELARQRQAEKRNETSRRAWLIFGPLAAFSLVAFIFWQWRRRRVRQDAAAT